MPTQVPFPVSVLRVHPCGVGLFHEGIPVLRRAARGDGYERGSWRRRKPINIHNLLVVFAQMKILFVVEEKVLRWGGDD